MASFAFESDSVHHHMYDKLAQPVMHAFSYTVPAKRNGGGAPRGSFITAGGGETRARGALRAS